MNNNLTILKTAQIKFQPNKKYPKRNNTKWATLSECFDIPVEKIVFNHEDNQTRQETKDLQHLEDTKASILSKGLDDPIVVSVDNNGIIMLESGHHRTNSFLELEMETIPAYIVTYKGKNEDEVGKNREEFLQAENNHNPVKTTTIKDAEKYLHKLKKFGTFAGQSDKQMETTALSYLKKHYTHLVEAKLKTAFKNFLKDIKPPTYNTYSSKDRKEVAKKHKYTTKAGEYDHNHNCFYVNANTGNAIKNVCTIDKMAKLPEGVTDASIHVFCSTASKDLASSKANRKQFLTQMMVANKNVARFLVEKIYFLPDVITQLECEVYEWTLGEDGAYYFKLVD